MRLPSAKVMAYTYLTPSWVILWYCEAILLALGQQPDLARGAGELMRGLQWALLPFLGRDAARLAIVHDADQDAEPPDERQQVVGQ